MGKGERYKVGSVRSGGGGRTSGVREKGRYFFFSLSLKDAWVSDHCGGNIESV